MTTPTTPITLKDGSTVQDPRLNRLIHFDPASRDFPVRTLEVAGAPLVTKTPRSYTWFCNAALDQGREGACVGFAWAHEAAARPYVRPHTNADAQAIYRRAQQLDIWPGEEPTYSGTSVLAGAKTMVERGVISQYRWAFGLPDLILALGYAGPAVLGIEWWDSMYAPDSDGWIQRTGKVVGGHALLANGVRLLWRGGTTWTQKRGTDWFAHVDLDRSWLRLHNSWGARWAPWAGSHLGAQCRITLTTAQALLKAQGEACIPVMRR